MSHHKISVIVSVYNRPRHLYWCLKGLCHQTFEDFEVIVSDDGSGKEVEKVIQGFKDKFARLMHVWGIHVPFGKVLAINRSVMASSGDLLVFIDADCIPDTNLIETYVRNRKEGNHFYPGGAFFVDERTSSKILSSNMPYEKALRLARASVPFSKKLEMIKRQINANVYRIFNLKRPKGYGGNIAIERDAFWKVGGYDEDFRMRGQDTDLVSRMVLEGISFVPLYTKAKVYHLHHEKFREDPRERRLRRELLKWKNYKNLYKEGKKISSVISSRLSALKT